MRPTQAKLGDALLAISELVTVCKDLGEDGKLTVTMLPFFRQMNKDLKCPHTTQWDKYLNLSQ